MSALERLFSPITIGTTEVKNRIAMAPMTTGWVPADGPVPERGESGTPVVAVHRA